jgi:phosphoribosylformylglycinamidine synthase II
VEFAMAVSKEVLEEIALTEKEYELIVERLGREPNSVELGMFGALWSEHCGYKHSKPLLALFPSEASHVVVPLGDENAGVVDVGDGLAVVFKVESHNHPSAVEPYQGAATGVGGIVRDIFAMGARPIALMNSLRFGPLTDSRNRYLFKGVVDGISGYGNCIGIPNVGGEVVFSSCYSGNPLVNTLCVGLLAEGKLMRSAAKTPGNILMLVGSDTGRDGIHGASGLASRTFEDEREMRPTVQVGNPFLEKVLIEACLEVADTGYLEGMQDLGAAGLTSSAIESTYRGDAGLELDVSRIPRREKGMTPYEVMLSESQERMLLIVKRGHEDDVKAVFSKWDIPCTAIGEVTSSKEAHIYENKRRVAHVALNILSDAPQYKLEGTRPSWQDGLQCIDMEVLNLPEEGPKEVLLNLLRSPSIASKEWVYRQYDHEVQTNTLLKPGSDAAVLRLRGTRRGIALAIDGNGRHCYLDPYNGGAMAVAEACRNVACTGARPLAITDCLNFGNPERPEIYYQLEHCIRGMAEACRVLQTPVVSGNVSLYNETQGEAIYPTPVVGALGVIDDADNYCTGAFKEAGDVVILLAASGVEIDNSSLGGSEYLEIRHGIVAGHLEIDLEFEARLQRLLVRLVSGGLLRSAHDCSDGGLMVALAESCIAAGVGFASDFNVLGRWDTVLFGEVSSRVVVSLRSEDLEDLRSMAEQEKVPWTRIGITTEDACVTIKNLMCVPVTDMTDAYRDGLEIALGG